jgi:hypothetical protein
VDRKNKDSKDNKDNITKQNNDIKFVYKFSEPNSINVQKFLDPVRTFDDVKVEEGDMYEFSIERNKIINLPKYRN